MMPLQFVTHSVSSVTYLLICSACCGCSRHRAAAHQFCLARDGRSTLRVQQGIATGGPILSHHYRITVSIATLQMPVRPSSLILAFIFATAERALLLEAKAAWEDPGNYLANWTSTTCPCGNVSTFVYGNRPPSAWNGVSACTGGQVAYL
jgi:hypothetical protein